jgi:23S rRNA (cytosine1962-C5)-methyltransferase
VLPKVVLKPRKALPFFGRHPWVFVGAISHVEGDPAPGAEVALVSERDEFIARGLFNPASSIRVRLYSWGHDQPLDEAFWSRRLDEAIRLRRDVLKLPQSSESACRLVFSEADGLSGLIVDRYGDWLLLQITSLAIFQRRELILNLLREKLGPAGIWLRTEKGIRDVEGLQQSDGLLWGTEPPRPLFIEEHGLRYGVDVVEGQKTGLFLDQRDNRLAAAKYLAGRRVLDMFCYSGGFAMHAVRSGGASEVLAVDVSEPALDLARANVEMNGLSRSIRFGRSDSFRLMEQLRDQQEKFGAVILDPPKMARHPKAVPDALRGYFGLNRLAADLLEPDGVLVTCSCTGHVGRDDFEMMLQDVAVDSGRNIQVLESRSAAADHPMSAWCPETNYLKCLICRVT